MILSNIDWQYFNVSDNPTHTKLYSFSVSSSVICFLTFRISSVHLMTFRYHILYFFWEQSGTKVEEEPDIIIIYIFLYLINLYFYIEYMYDWVEWSGVLYGIYNWKWIFWVEKLYQKCLQCILSFFMIMISCNCKYIRIMWIVFVCNMWYVLFRNVI